MNFDVFFDLVLTLIANPMVIITAVMCLMICSFANYICKYKKKPPKPKVKKTAAPAPAPAAESSSEGGEGDGGTED